MEALYAKLYDKYNTLKKKRFSELDELNKNQEVKFLNYVSAAEELIQHLKDENDRLRAQVNDLRSEIGSVRSTKDEQCAEYQKLLTEENQKNRTLSEEVERLQKELSLKLQTAELTSGEISNGSMRRMTRKRSREARAQTEGSITPGSSYQDGLMVREAAGGSSKETTLDMDISNNQHAERCKICADNSGGGVRHDNGHTDCQFQALVEYIVGMKLSTSDQNEGICISALHQSSGYSFNLTWVKKATGEEPELLYRVSTLGTFERVAPEWMRSALMFSMSMCPIFFERVARVIKLHQ